MQNHILLCGGRYVTFHRFLLEHFFPLFLGLLFLVLYCETANKIAVAIKNSKIKILDGISPQMVTLLANPPQTVKAAYRRSAITLINFMTVFTQFVTPLFRRLHHFCVALMVTHKFRLCLHPHGMLRVQSLHLPAFTGLARRCLHITMIFY